MALRGREHVLGALMYWRGIYAGTVNLSGRVSRVQPTGKVHRNLVATHTADFSPDLECLAPGSSVLGSSDVIAAEVEEVIDLIVS